MAKPYILHANLPRPFVGQLQVPVQTKGEDCGVRSLINLVLASSGGLVGPKDAAGQVRWTRAVRRWMGVPSGATSPIDWLRAWQHPNLTKLFKKHGLVKPNATRYNNAEQDLILAGLADGLTFEVGVVYKVLREGGAPVGSATFDTGHAIAYTGREKHTDHIDIVDLDPLFDGRHIGVPHGPLRAQFQPFKAAMAAFARQSGRFDGISVPLATKIKK